MLNIAHRGASGSEPENTLLAFRRAFEMGAQGIELDVHLCRSGELVVIHDETLDRTTDGAGLVAEYSLDELRKLDAGKGQAIPTLSEVLQLAHERGIVFIELKADNCAQAVLATIEQHSAHGGRLDELCVISFNHPLLVEIRRMNPLIRTGANFVGNLVSHAQVAELAGAWSANPCIEFLDSATVDDAHARGLKLFTWTCNNPLEIAKARLLGVDGVMTDHPERV